jgi:hypothetical protein
MIWKKAWSWKTLKKGVFNRVLQNHIDQNDGNSGKKNKKEEARFRPGCSCVDQINTLRMIIYTTHCVFPVLHAAGTCFLLRISRHNGSFFARRMSIWNSLPISIRTVSGLGAFKRFGLL